MNYEKVGSKKLTDPLSCKLRLVEERDIPLLYDILKEFLMIPNADVNERPLPPFEESKNFVMKYLFDNENHEYHKWYIVINENDEPMGSVWISKKNYIAYHILPQFRHKGMGQKAIKLLMEANPRKRYFAAVNQKNEASINFIKKFGFQPKGIIFEKITD